MNAKQPKDSDPRQFDSKLLPILDEGVQMVKLITFRELQRVLPERHPERDRKDINLLAGALINELFLTPNQDDFFQSFCRQHQPLVDQEIERLGDTLQRLKPLLTDAIRIQFLADSQRGAANPSLLEQGRTLDILEVEREVPMPAKFIHLVKQVGQAHGILAPDPTADSES